MLGKSSSRDRYPMGSFSTASPGWLVGPFDCLFDAHPIPRNSAPTTVSTQQISGMERRMLVPLIERLEWHGHVLMPVSSARRSRHGHRYMPMPRATSKLTLHRVLDAVIRRLLRDRDVVRVALR